MGKLNGAALAQKHDNLSTNGVSQIELWPKDWHGHLSKSLVESVGSRGQIYDVNKPRLIMHAPAHPKGLAIIVVSGGGYIDIEQNLESRPVSEWLATQDITAFELLYRLPHSGWPDQAPFADGQRAIRLVRFYARQFGIRENAIGMLGFSAGGHLTGMTMTQPERQWESAHDSIDQVSARPDFAGLIYPILCFGPGLNHNHTFDELQRHVTGKDKVRDFSVSAHVTPMCPPVFLAHAGDDKIAPVQNSLLMYEALLERHIPTELHIFRQGGHGWHRRPPGEETRIWQQLFLDWLHAIGEI